MAVTKVLRRDISEADLLKVHDKYYDYTWKVVCSDVDVRFTREDKTHVFGSAPHAKVSSSDTVYKHIGVVERDPCNRRDRPTQCLSTGWGFHSTAVGKVPRGDSVITCTYDYRVRRISFSSRPAERMGGSSIPPLARVPSVDTASAVTAP